MAFRSFVVDESVNASIGWLLVGGTGLAVAWSFLADDLLWAGFSLVVATVASLPALVSREWTAMVPWPVLSVATLGVLARSTGRFPEIGAYLALATLAIVIVVELVGFTAVELSRRFAIGFGVLTTLALEALWIIAQFYSDVWLGTEFLTTQTALQKDIVLVTIVAFAVGATFLWLFDVFESRTATDRPATNGQPR